MAKKTVPTTYDPSSSTIFVLFGATGDLAVKKIFPALAGLMKEGALGPHPHIIAVSRRDWLDTDFHNFLREKKTVTDVSFFQHVSYSIVDIDAGAGFGELAARIKALQKDSPQSSVIYYTSLAPAHQKEAVSGLKKSGLLYKASKKSDDAKAPKLLLEKPFGTDLASAQDFDTFLLSFLSEDQICRIDHYLGKDTVQAIMDIHENTKEFSNLISAENIASIRVRMFEEKGIDGRGASYDGVGAFRDVGQNHILEMLAVLSAELPPQATGEDWRLARATSLKHLAPPTDTCELSRRGQYQGYQTEIGVRPGSETETAFEVITSLSDGKLKGVPIILEAGKRMGASESSVDVVFKESVDEIPLKMTFRIQPEQEIVIEYRNGMLDTFDIPKTRDAYGNIILAALRGSSREFVGSKEIETLWSYADRIVACWSKVPLELYSPEKPFLIQ